MAVTVQLKPRPTISVLAAVETQHVTELGYTAPSLLSCGVLGPKRTLRWKCTIRSSHGDVRVTERCVSVAPCCVSVAPAA